MNQINSLVYKNKKVQISCDRNAYKLLFLPNRTVFPNGDISLNSVQLLECLEKIFIYAKLFLGNIIFYGLGCTSIIEILFDKILQEKLIKCWLFFRISSTS